MCIIVAVPKGKSVSDEILDTCWEGNSDGGGFMFPFSQKVEISKHLKKEEFLEAYKASPAQGRAHVLHFRIATHGKVDLENTHPFRVNPKIGMAHNGVLFTSSKAMANVGESDTSIFVKEYIQPLSDPDLFHNPGMRNLLMAAAGGNNKLVFLDGKGRTSIINEDAGYWDEGVWFSNKSYKAVTRSYGGGLNGWLATNRSCTCSKCKGLKKHSEIFCKCTSCKGTKPHKYGAYQPLSDKSMSEPCACIDCAFLKPHYDEWCACESCMKLDSGGYGTSNCPNRKDDDGVFDELLEVPCYNCKELELLYKFPFQRVAEGDNTCTECEAILYCLMCGGLVSKKESDSEICFSCYSPLGVDDELN